MTKNTINQTQLKNNDGWQLCPQTPTYVDATTIKFTGTTIDNTISKGMKLKFTNNSTVKYYTITAFATAGSDRAMILSGPVALVSGAITNLYFSTENQPLGFPYTTQPSQTGWTYTTAAGSTTASVNVTFPVAFTSVPKVYVSALGYKSGTVTPTAITEFTGVYNGILITTFVSAISATGFTVYTLSYPNAMGQSFNGITWKAEV